jgi:hypothetical protein
MDLLKQIKLHLVLFFMDSWLYKSVLQKIIPFIRFSLYYTSFRGWKYHKGYALLQPGDIVLSVDTNKATSAIISKATAAEGGRKRALVHAGLCISKDGKFEIAEMTHNNYTHSCFFDFCKEAERVVIIRCNEFTPEYIEKILIPKATSDKFKAAKYNWAFRWTSEDLYCSQLIYRADAAHKMDVDIGDLIGLGVPYISPEGLYNMKNGTKVWDSDSEIATAEYF